MNSVIHLSLIAIGLFTCRHVAGSQVVRLRGVPISRTSLYPADSDFECLDGSLFIPFNRVNDDYCDCADGSDEPGTSACSNGSFYCHNPGHKSKFIPSSWVNDGVCDCCDATDEYSSGKNCVDNCHDLGKEARVEAQRLAELAKEGNKIRLDMINRGKQAKSDQQSQLVKLRSEYEEAERIKKEKEAIKNQLEEREKIALEKYKPVEPERVEGEEEEINVSEAEDYFTLLDSDTSGTVTIAELQVRQTFDVNRNGEVTADEAKYFLNNKEEVDLQEFMDTAWANIKPYIMLEEGTFKKPSGDVEGGEQEEEAKEGEEEENAEEAEAEAETEVAAPQYDEETQAIVDEAEKARNQLKEADDAAGDLRGELRKVEDQIDRDYGPDEEFLTLDGQCFDYTDLEYVYTMCPFGRASQKSKSGGSEVILGHWHEWADPQANGYTAMKFDRGLACWNGPTRTVFVSLTCGMENKVLSVSEPNRCEYAMQFSTPAVCHVKNEAADSHDEL